MSTIDGCQSGRKVRAYKPLGSSVRKKTDRFLEVHKLLFGWSMRKDQAERIREEVLKIGLYTEVEDGSSSAQVI